MNFPGKRKIIKKYTNGEITVTWKPDLCNHSTICFSQLPHVFRPADRPWVQMDAANTDEIVKVVEMCPTLALTWEWNDKSKQSTVGKKEATAEPAQEKAAEPQTIVRIVKGGPVIIRGTYKLIDARGEEHIQTRPVSICRCGISKRKPYCDGSHSEIIFDED